MKPELLTKKVLTVLQTTYLYNYIAPFFRAQWKVKVNCKQTRVALETTALVWVSNSPFLPCPKKRLLIKWPSINSPEYYIYMYHWTMTPFFHTLCFSLFPGIKIVRIFFTCLSCGHCTLEIYFYKSCWTYL